jgi:hypothetical protein
MLRHRRESTLVEAAMEFLRGRFRLDEEELYQRFCALQHQIGRRSS